MYFFSFFFSILAYLPYMVSLWFGCGHYHYCNRMWSLSLLQSDVVTITIATGCGHYHYCNRMWSLSLLQSDVVTITIATGCGHYHYCNRMWSLSLLQSDVVTITIATGCGHYHYCNRMKVVGLDEGPPAYVVPQLFVQHCTVGPLLPSCFSDEGAEL